MNCPTDLIRQQVQFVHYASREYCWRYAFLGVSNLTWNSFASFLIIGDLNIIIYIILILWSNKKVMWKKNRGILITAITSLLVLSRGVILRRFRNLNFIDVFINGIRAVSGSSVTFESVCMYSNNWHCGIQVTITCRCSGLADIPNVTGDGNEVFELWSANVISKRRW